MDWAGRADQAGWSIGMRSIVAGAGQDRVCTKSCRMADQSGYIVGMHSIAGQARPDGVCSVRIVTWPIGLG